MKIEVTKEMVGKRIDHTLVGEFKDVSRSQIQKNIESGAVLVNDKVPTKHQFLKEGDIIEVKKIEAKKKVDYTSNLKTKIIFENEDYLLVEKPVGMLVHATDKSKEKTLIDHLIEMYPFLKKVGEDPNRPAIVHRLDRDASGLMVVAKNQDSFDWLKKQFKLRKVNKKYRALVYGHVSPPSGEINFSIAWSKTNYAKKAANADTVGREALTKYWVDKFIKNTSLVDIEPKTGRTHQIRVHFYSVGHPLVGDRLYSSKQYKRLDVGRLMLHAYHLAFYDLHNQWQEYDIDLPKDFLDALAKI